MAFDISRLPPKVQSVFYDKDLDWQVTYWTARENGISDSNTLTNILFYKVHLELVYPGGSIPIASSMKNYHALVEDWKSKRRLVQSLAHGSPTAAKPAAVKPAPQPGVRPRALTPKEIVGIRPGRAGADFVSWRDPAAPSGVAIADSGEIWDAPEGKRLIVHARQWEVSIDGEVKPAGVVTFLQLKSDSAMLKEGSVYRQNRRGFLDDVLFYSPIARAGKKLNSTQVLIEAEMNFLMGIASASGVVVLADTGLAATEWILKNKREFSRWSAAIGLILGARTTLKRHCPTLWDKIVDSALLGAWKGTRAAVVMFGTDLAGNIPESFVSDQKKVEKATGSLLGKLGARGFSGRLTALKAIWITLQVVAIGALKATPGAIKITYKERRKAALDMIASLRKAGVALTEKDAETVVDEVVRNAAKVEGALARLKRGFEALR